jgi:hypothetical protein
MKRIKLLRAQQLEQLDIEYANIRQALVDGFASEEFTAKGQRRQSVFLNQFKIRTEKIQAVNRLLGQLNQ